MNLQYKLVLVCEKCHADVAVADGTVEEQFCASRVNQEIHAMAHKLDAHKCPPKVCCAEMNEATQLGLTPVDPNAWHFCPYCGSSRDTKDTVRHHFPGPRSLDQTKQLATCKNCGRAIRQVCGMWAHNDDSVYCSPTFRAEPA